MSRCKTLPGLVCLPFLIAAQDQSPAKIRTETNAVEVDISVRDGKGEPARNLTRDDFKISDEGKPRPIQIFSYNKGAAAAPVETAGVRPLPPHVFSNRTASLPPSSHATVILLDAVNTWYEGFIRSRKAVVDAVDKVPADERIAVYVIARQGIILLQDYTADRDLLLKSVAAYFVPGLRPAPAAGGGRRLVPSPESAPPPPNATMESRREKELGEQEGAEDVRDALERLAAMLAALPGRKSVFWLTQGFPPAELRGFGKPAWEKTISALNQADVAVNAIDSNGLMGPPRRWSRDSLATLQQIADETGGETYFNRNDLDGALAAGIRSARETYTLGFYLADRERDGKFHRLTVRTGQPNLQLSYRPGYFADDGSTVNAAPKLAMESALMSPVDAPAIGITAEVVHEPGQSRGTIVVRMTIDLATLKLTQADDLLNAKFDEMFLEWNAQGRQLAKVSDTRELQIPASQKETYESHGVVLTQNLPLAEGTSRLSLIVRDTATGRIGSLSMPLENPPK